MQEPKLKIRYHSTTFNCFPERRKEKDLNNANTKTAQGSSVVSSGGYMNLLYMDKTA